MKSVGIFYFSGTGNTELVALMIQEELRNLGCDVDLFKMEEVQKGLNSVDWKKYDLIGMGCQIIGFGIPNLVKDFINCLPKNIEKEVFVFRTAGGVARINYNASKPMIHKLKRKGCRVFYECIFSISSNWIKRFDDVIIWQLYEATRKKIPVMCREILDGETKILHTGLRLRLGIAFIMPVSSWILRFLGKDMVIQKSCTGCGLCMKQCPSGNIYKKGEKMKFRSSCSGCMRCIYNCPKQAIHLRMLSFFMVDGGYHINRILNGMEKVPEQVFTEADLNNVTVPPFFKEYIE